MQQVSLGLTGLPQRDPGGYERDEAVDDGWSPLGTEGTDEEEAAEVAVLISSFVEDCGFGTEGIPSFFTPSPDWFGLTASLLTASAT